MTFDRVFIWLMIGSSIVGCGGAEESHSRSAPVADGAREKTLAESLADRALEGRDPATLAAHEAELQESARAAGIDVELLRADAKAMMTAEDPNERERLRAEFEAKYGAWLASRVQAERPEVDAETAGGSGEAAGERDGQAEQVGSTSAELLRPPSLTRCSSLPVISAPFEASSPLPPPGTPVSGAFRVQKGVSVGAVDERDIFTIRDTIEVETPAEVKVRVTASVNVAGGTAEAYVDLPPLGYAASGATLNMRVMDGATVMCSVENVLARAEYLSRNVISAGLRTLRCEFDRARDGARRFTVEISAGVWASAGGVAHALVDAHGSLRSIATETCIEPDRFIDGRGLCVKPFSVPAVDFSQAKVDECLGTADERWRYNTTTKQIIHAQSGLCLEAYSPVSNGGFIIMMRCDANRPTQGWNRGTNRQFSSVASPGFCLDGRNGGVPGERVQAWVCLGPDRVGPNQLFRFQ